MYICNIPMCVVQAYQVEYEIHSSPAALITKRCAAAEQPHPSLVPSPPPQLSSLAVRITRYSYCKR